MEVGTKCFIARGDFDWYQSTIPKQDVYVEGNMANISKTMPIDISQKPEIIEHIMIGADCSPEEVTALFKESNCLSKLLLELGGDIVGGAVSLDHHHGHYHL